jgi:hypothetical protein
LLSNRLLGLFLAVSILWACSDAPMAPEAVQTPSEALRERLAGIELHRHYVGSLVSLEGERFPVERLQTYRFSEDKYEFTDTLEGFPTLEDTNLPWDWVDEDGKMILFHSLQRYWGECYAKQYCDITVEQYQTSRWNEEEARVDTVKDRVFVQTLWMGLDQVMIVTSGSARLFDVVK